MIFFDLIRSDIYFTGFNKLPDFMIYGILGLIFLCDIISRALLLKKIGKKPWLAFIPFYGLYQYYEIFWKGIYGIIRFLIHLVFSMLLPPDVRLLKAGPVGYLCILLFMGEIVISLIGALKKARSFGKDYAFAFGLVFLEDIFDLIIALSDCEYLGPTLREYNSEKLIDRKKIKETKRNNSNKEYMIDLYKKRSIIALISCLTTIIFAIGALESNVILYSRDDKLNEMFMYFTMNSNVLTTLAASCIVPYAINGIRKKRFSYPRWTAVFYYSSVICTTLTMVFAVFVISLYDFEMAFGGYNFFLHIICPAAILISFFQVESGYTLSRDDSLICLTPFALYGLLYTIEVFLIGEENGGWPDLYNLVSFFPVSVVYPLMFMLALGVSLTIGTIYNRLGERRRKKLMLNWPKDATPVEIKIEAYGLGRYMGMHEETNEVSLPLDILKQLADTYDIKAEELTRAYTKGIIDGSKERNIYKEYKRNDFSALFGTPYKLSDLYKQETEKPV